jgi:signal transduction histidine kinase
MTSTETARAEAASGSPAARGRALGTYAGLWRTVPRELGFLALTLPIAVVGLTVTTALFSAGIALLAIVVGVVVVVLALFVARGFGSAELTRLEWAGRPPIRRPLWPESAGRGFWRSMLAVVGDGHYWLYLLFSLVVNLALSTLTWTITVFWLSVTLGGLAYWFVDAVMPDADNDWSIAGWIFQEDRGAGTASVWSWLDSVVFLALGLLFLAVLPFVTRGLVELHHLVARGMLGSFASDVLRRQVGDLEASRGAAISAEGHSLRRLERDIHDGPQQRLVRLQMDLAAADRQIDKNPSRARELIAEAMQQSRDALEELRALSRGFAPPILLDRGLVAALESAAVRSAVPVRVMSELPADLELPQEIERNAYFVASEAITNAVKHSGATQIDVRAALRRVAETDDTWLDLVVTDNGRGGAVAVASHGLAGLDDRLRGLGGTLEIDSPAGGPTTVSAHVPLSTSLPGSIVTPSAP